MFRIARTPSTTAPLEGETPPVTRQDDLVASFTAFSYKPVGESIARVAGG